MRLRLLLSLTVAMFTLTGTALAQDTDPTSGYTTTTPAATTPAPKPKAPTQGQGNAPEAAGEEQSSAVPQVAAQPAGSAPSKLAFTGAEPLLLILGGMVLAGGAMTLLVRDRRTTQDR